MPAFLGNLVPDGCPCSTGSPPTSGAWGSNSSCCAACHRSCLCRPARRQRAPRAVVRNRVVLVGRPEPREASRRRGWHPDSRSRHNKDRRTISLSPQDSRPLRQAAVEGDLCRHPNRFSGRPPLLWLRRPPADPTTPDRPSVEARANGAAAVTELRGLWLRRQSRCASVDPNTFLVGIVKKGF